MTVDFENRNWHLFYLRLSLLNERFFMVNLETVLNQYGEPATHDDCLDYHLNDCDGEMVYWTNINTGNSSVRCARHAFKADNRQYKIHSEYLNDTVND